MPRHRSLIPFLLSFIILICATIANAQLDPEPRTYLEGGGDIPIRGNGPLDGYLFLLWNRPQFPKDDWYLRVAAAPTYLTSELVRDRWPADGHAIGMGIDGGFFQNSFTDYRNGINKKNESFWGGGGGGSLSYYWRQLKIAGVLPVEGLLRLRPEYAVYTKDSHTSSNFRLPAGSAIYRVRGGFRVGGVPPELFPKQAMEVSIYHQASYRATAGRFGLPEEPQKTDHFTQQTWGRALGIFTPWLDHTVSLSLTGGIAEDTDVLSAFRLGAPFRFRSELPLILHGYNPEEVFARRFVLVNAFYHLAPIPGVDWFRVQFSGDYARVAFFKGHSLPHHDLPAVGADLIAALTKSATFVLGYGYGFDVPRRAHTGGQEVHLLVEKKF